MKVISKKGSTKLIKGHIYEVGSMDNSCKYPWLYLKDFSGSYSPKSFTDLAGKELGQIAYQKQYDKDLEIGEIEIGDVFVCKSDRFKTLLKGGYYKVKSIKKAEHKYSSKQVYFEGFTRSINIDNWRFRRLNKAELRELNLGNILFNTPLNIIKTSNIDKLTSSDKSDLILMETLAKSLLDRNRHEYDLLDWASKKHKGTYNITREKYDKLLGMKLSDILELIENQTK